MTAKQNQLEKAAWAIYEAGNADPYGFAVAHSEVDVEDLPRHMDWSFCEEEIDDERMQALLAGAEPKASELELLKIHFLRSSFESPGDNTTAIYFCAAPKVADMPPVLVLLMSGHHTSGLDSSFFGGFKDTEAALAALRDEFYLQDDYLS